jgi:hypothetical protein
MIMDSRSDGLSSDASAYQDSGGGKCGVDFGLVGDSRVSLFSAHDLSQQYVNESSKS